MNLRLGKCSEYMCGPSMEVLRRYISIFSPLPLLLQSALGLAELTMIGIQIQIPALLPTRLLFQTLNYHREAPIKKTRPPSRHRGQLRKTEQTLFVILQKVTLRYDTYNILQCSWTNKSNDFLVNKSRFHV